MSFRTPSNKDIYYTQPNMTKTIVLPVWLATLVLSSAKNKISVICYLQTNTKYLVKRSTIKTNWPLNKSVLAPTVEAS